MSLSLFRFLVDFNEPVDLKVLSWPRDLVAEVWREHTFTDELIGSCNLAIPGEHGESSMGTVTSSYHLQGQVPYIPQWEIEHVERAKLLMQQPGSKTQPSGEHFCSGSFECEVRWGTTEILGDMEEDEDEVCIPEVPPLPKDDRKPKVARGSMNLYGDQLNDLDPNDPLNLRVLQEGAGQLDQVADLADMFRVNEHVQKLHALGAPGRVTAPPITSYHLLAPP